MSGGTQTTTPRPKLWLPEDLADYLGVPVGWIYKRTRKDGPEMIPHLKLGKYLRFDPESLAFQEWLARHEAFSNNLTLSLPVNTVRIKEKTANERRNPINGQ